MTLKNWLLNGWLTPHKTSPQEIADLLSLVSRDLSDCQLPGLSPDWRLNIAYNAALQAATVALAASGYRAARESHHFRIIQSLAYTIGAPAILIANSIIFGRKETLAGTNGRESPPSRKRKRCFFWRKRSAVMLTHGYIRTIPIFRNKMFNDELLQRNQQASNGAEAFVC